ncbi:MAG: acyl-CoA thioesterase [Eubacterium sp.]|nr:acyl-CoA thioesterase [Eubacterium sp.]
MSNTESYIRVINYYETDQMHVVHHSNYARYLEEARLNLMDQVGLSYDKMEKLGIIIPVLELHDYYIKSITYGDVIEIVPTIVKLTPVRFTLEYEIFRSGTDELIHRAQTSHAFVDSEFKPMNMKKKFPDLYEKMQAIVRKAE